MPKPVCVPCHRFFRPEKNGFVWTEMMPIGLNALPGLSNPQAWEPYKVWNGDKWKCHGCGTEIIVGNASRAIEGHQSDFKEKEKYSQLAVNDC